MDGHRMQSRKPDFVLVGAPKCGTATLSDWLDQHPSIFVMNPREPNFFGSDLIMRRHFDSAETYLQQFEGHEGELCGEGTTWYLYSENAPEEIFAFNSKAKILMILRNPIEVVISLHNYRMYFFEESERDIEKVLDRENGLLGRWARSGDPKDVMQIYYDVARYSAGVERYFKRFGREQVRVLFFEDLKTSPDELIQDVFEFLGVDKSFVPRFERSNEGGAHRSALVGQILFRPGRIVRAAARIIPAPVRHAVARAVQRANTDYGKTPQVRADVRARIATALRPDIARLESLVGRDLSHWR